MCGLSASFQFAVVSRLVDREARASDTAITVAGDTTPGTRIRGGEAARPYPSVRIVLARRLSVAGHGLVAPRRKSPEGNLTMSSTEKLDTHHKALTLNLDASAFGSFAEIGAGQEVARWFLVVGGASGTVAKTISAYDKEVSDDLYGSG